MKTNKTLSRRQFLAGTGGAYLTLPFLPSLLPKTAWAQTVSPPKRLVAMLTMNGTNKATWYPAVDPTTVIAPNVRASSFAATSGNISTIHGAELSALKSKVLLIRGLDSVAAPGHSRSEILACAHVDPNGLDTSSTGISIDQVLGASKKVYQAEPKMRTLSVIGSKRGDNISFISSGGTIVPAPFFYDMKTAFENLFSGVGAGSQIEAMKAKDLTLVDRVFQQYKRVMTSTQLSQSDRMRLDSHVTHVFELEKRIKEFAVASGCVVPPAGVPHPVSGDAFAIIGSTNQATFEAYLNNMMDLIVGALRCDLTRLVCFTPFDHNVWFKFIPSMYGSIHTLSHNGNYL
ncbi:MAG TPA: DUF1552 domain-containing protein, partial [Bdellovibrionales bacterium]|nr:DUF1552 domain-containing protein [Bdellovibrionales bacterium]